MSTEETRHFIRHPTDIPITVEAASISPDEKSQTQNVSMGGLCFVSSVPMDVGSHVNIQIEAVTPIFRAKCKVAWCHWKNGSFEVGIRFISSDEAYRARMVQQVCHIEQFRYDLAAKRNVDISDISREEAAKQWIKTHAADFPNFPMPQET